MYKLYHDKQTLSNKEKLYAVERDKLHEVKQTSKKVRFTVEFKSKFREDIIMTSRAKSNNIRFNRWLKMMQTVSFTLQAFKKSVVCRI